MSARDDSYTPLKCGVIWLGILAVTMTLAIALTVMVNHYNDSEASRANACTAERGVYGDGHCSWSADR